MRKPKLALPAQAVDCHAHVFGPKDKYPYAATRLYTPPPVYLEDYLAMLRTAGLARGVLVQTGLYGNDNSFIVDAIKAHPGTFARHRADRRGRHRQGAAAPGRSGIRGFRVNRTAKTGLEFGVARRLAERVRSGLARAVPARRRGSSRSRHHARRLRTEVVIDHMGRPDPRKGVDAPGFQALLRLLRSGRGWANSRRPTAPRCRSRPIATSRRSRTRWWPRARPPGLGLRLAACAAGEDHAGDGDLVDQIAVWVPDEAVRKRILVDNAERLYGFERP